MKIIFQGEELETEEATLGAFLKARGMDTAHALVEFGDDVLVPGTDLDQVALKPGIAVNVFRVTAGG